MREILCLSLGADSSALAVYLDKKYPNRIDEYILVDNKFETPEAYQYFPKLQRALRGKITVLHSDFGALLQKWGNFLCHISGE